METLCQAVHETETVIVPLVQFPAQKSLRCEFRPSRLTTARGRRCWIKFDSNLIEQGI
jgi:hypothetical protein